MRLHLVPILVASGCMAAGNVHGGTAVGNPPDALVRTHPGPDVSLSVGELRGAVLIQAPCDLDVAVTETVVGTVDLLAGRSVELERDPPCGLALHADGLALRGTADGDAMIDIEVDSFEIELGRDDAWSASSFEANGHFVLELGGLGWLQDLRLELADGDLVIDPDDSSAEVLIDRVASSTGLYPDPDGNGELTDGDRAAAAMGSWNEPERDPEVDD